MSTLPDDDLAALVRSLRDEVHSLVERVAALERRGETAVDAAADSRHLATPPAASAVASTAPPAPATPPEASEEDLLVIAAAVAAFVGVRARIRQVRLIQSSAWAQVGRATVHASHRVH